MTWGPPEITTHIDVPEGISVEVIDKTKLRVRGPLGELERDFSKMDIILWLENEGRRIMIGVPSTRRKYRARLNAVRTHIRNMFTGVTKGFTYHLKVYYKHFPIKVEVEGNKLLIKNFLGEKAPRVVEIPEGVTVEVREDDVIIRGLDIEKVGMLWGRIRLVQKIRDKDPRKFMDGLYLWRKL